MASVKLTNSLRLDIVHALLEQGGFYKVEETKKQAYIKACHTLYYNVFKSYLASFAFISNRFFRYSDSFGITFDTNDINDALAICHKLLAMLDTDPTRAEVMEAGFTKALPHCDYDATDDIISRLRLTSNYGDK